MIRMWTAIAAVLLAGCAAHQAADDIGSHGSGAQSAIMLHDSGAAAPIPGFDPNAARHAIPVVISLELYHLTVPAGAISGNEEFWKRVDETRIDVATYDLLFKNGIRAGIARDAEWKYFKGLLAQYPSARQQPGRTEPGKLGYIELEMRTNVPYQNLFWLDDHDGLCGRTDERCDDLLGLSFEASAHHPGQAIIKLCPIVRGLRRYYHVTILGNDQMQIEQKQPTQIFDLRLEAVVPMNDCLIVAPSKQAKWPTCLGSTFLTSDGKTEPIEHVLVIVPHAYRTDELPAVAQQGRRR